MKYGIIVDSGSDYYKYQFKNSQVGYERIPIKIEVGNQEIVDDKNANIKEATQLIESYEGKTSTCAPAPGEWKEAFEKYDIVFVITITGGLSGSIRSAYAAKDMIAEENQDKKIYIFDSLSTGPEVGLLIRKIGEYIDEGYTPEEIEKLLPQYQKHTNLTFLLEHLDNFVKNGRVSKTQGRLVSILGIGIIGRASEKGELQIDEKIRGKRKKSDKVFNIIQDRGYCGGRVIISHYMNKEMAEAIKKLIKAKYQNADVSIMETGVLCSYYMQKEGVCVGFES